MTLLGQWVEPVRLAMHAVIQKLANRFRQKLVQEFTLELIANEHHLKGSRGVNVGTVFVYAGVLI